MIRTRFALLMATATLVAAPLQGQTGRVTVDVGARNPATSPDGSTIAVSILGKVWTLPSSGGRASQVTQGLGWDRHPAWSPDGRFLAYSHWTSGGTDLVIRNMDTGLSRTVHHVPDEILQIDFDPAGENVYFIRQTSQYNAHLWRIPVQGGEEEQLTFTENWHEWSFALSPEGDEVLLETGRFEGNDLFVLGLEEKSAVRVTDTPEREMSVAWSADGRRHAYVITHNGIDRIMVETDGGAPREIDRRPFGQSELSFAPDGSLLMVNARLLYRLDAATGDSEALEFEADFVTAENPSDDLVIHNVRLFDAVGDEAVDNAYVVVRDGRIVRVGSGAIDPPDGVPTIDGAERTLMPSLMDNHYHYWAPHNGEDLLARGVTAVRDPGVAISDGMDYKDASRLGLLPAPDIYSSGPLIDGPGGYHPMADVTIDDPAAAAPLVRALKAQGVDGLKAYFLLEPDVLAAVVAEAKVQGLPVTGHIGVRTSWSEAMDAGINGFSHVRVWRDFLAPEVQPDGRDGSLDSGRNRVARMQADWSDIDPESAEVQALIARMAETGTAIDPTIFIQKIEDDARPGFNLEQFSKAQQSFDRMKMFVRRSVEAGVPLLAGTDNVVLNDELETYAEADIPNAAILKAATINGARWIGHGDEFGTIEVGKRAHLMLIDGDPLEDVKVLRNVDLVVKDGVIVFRRGL